MKIGLFNMKNWPTEYLISFGIGILVLISSVVYTSLQVARADVLSSSLPLTYLSLLILPLGVALALFGLHPVRLAMRRKVETSELNDLYAEVKGCKNNADATQVCLKHAEEESDRLRKFEGDVFELDVLPLRKALVDLYSKSELMAKVKYELELLNEYMVKRDDVRDYQALKDNLDEIIDDCEQEEEDNSPNCNKLRAQLKVLREKVAWYDNRWAEGEQIIKGVSYWATISAITFVIVGILPIIHIDGTGLLNILHWGSLGCAGAMLSVLVGVRGLDVPEVGEQEGKQVRLQAVVNITIGAVSSILLYAALNGEILGGKIFPQFPIHIGDDSYFKNIGLSIFWGILAGFSLKILTAMVGLAESQFGKEEES